jgi:hypothetical protein
VDCLNSVLSRISLLFASLIALSESPRRYTDSFSCSNQLFNVRQTISFLSQGTTLLPGSLIMTGTPHGVGFVRKPPIFLKNGDEVRVWMDGGIGTLINSVVEEGKARL